MSSIEMQAIPSAQQGGSVAQHAEADSDVPKCNPWRILVPLLFVAFIAWAVTMTVLYATRDNNDHDTCETPVNVQWPRLLSTDYARSQLPRITVRDCLQGVIHNETAGGYVVFTSTEGYNNASQDYSLFFKSYPIAVVYAESVETIQNTLRCSNTYQVLVRPRCGRHSNAGQSLDIGAITLDVSLMKDVRITTEDEILQNGGTSAIAVVQSGNTAGQAAYRLWSQSNGVYGLPIGQKPTVGIAGLTLGGGFGFATRQHGMLCDRLVAVEGVMYDGTVVFATKDNEHADLMYASCGGGGGTNVVVSTFYFRPTNISQNVTKFHFEIPLNPIGTAIEYITAYQKFSYAFDSRATANLEVEATNLTEIAGYFSGTIPEFYAAVTQADADASTNGMFSNLSRWHVSNIPYIQAVLQLSGWDTDVPESLLGLFENEQSYFQYKSFMLTDIMPEEAIRLIIERNQVEGRNGFIFEFQSLGGANSAYSLVSNEATAVTRRKSVRHCLMFKSTGFEIDLGYQYLGIMSNTSFELSQMLGSSGLGAYTNHLDYEIANWAYAYWGNEDGATDANGNALAWNYTMGNLQRINLKYDPLNLISTFQNL